MVMIMINLSDLIQYQNSLNVLKLRIKIKKILQLCKKNSQYSKLISKHDLSILNLNSIFEVNIFKFSIYCKLKLKVFCPAFIMRFNIVVTFCFPEMS
jgi:hypothetical protein